MGIKGHFFPLDYTFLSQIHVLNNHVSEDYVSKWHGKKIFKLSFYQCFLGKSLKTNKFLVFTNMNSPENVYNVIDDRKIPV